MLMSRMNEILSEDTNQFGPGTDLTISLLAVMLVIAMITMHLYRAAAATIKEQTEKIKWLEPRADVCEAAKSISGATVALIYEPAPDSDGELRCTAITHAGAPLNRPAQAGSAAHEAFETRRAVLVTDAAGARVGDHAAWLATGRPRSVLYQPLTRHGVALGVLVIGWSEDIQAGGTHTTIASLLAHEAAAKVR